MRFCRVSINYWRKLTGERVRYILAPNMAVDRHSQISSDVAAFGTTVDTLPREFIDKRQQPE